ncbi:MAG: HlyC/CorC family transporter [Puniceicoccaceae bacterium]|nr:MAG: HlyC/CorC family transporter [Puniceicoccaceae bacterium]
MTFELHALLLILLLILLLLGMNALFVAAEFSLVKLRFSRFNAGMVEETRRHRRIERMLNAMGTYLKVIRFGVTLCTVGIGFLLVPVMLALLGRLGWLPETWEFRTALAVSFLLAACVHFILGELVPRSMALQFPVRTLAFASWPVGAFRVVAAPPIALLSAITSRILRVFRIESRVDLNLVDVEAQIHSLVSGEEKLPPLAETILHNVLDLRKRIAQDILIPRNQLQYLDLYDSLETNLDLARRAGHTRYPLCEGDLDHCVGLVHIKDLFRHGTALARIDLRKIRREMLFISVNDPLETVLQRLLKQRRHFALVVDEFGGTVGAITLENVLEELVGDIQDEFDKDEVLIRRGEVGELLVAGLAPLHDVGDALGLELTGENVSTFGGFITSELGYLPQHGEVVTLGRLEIRILEVSERRIISTAVKVRPALESEGGEG